eukprot:s1430_g10.t1
MAWTYGSCYPGSTITAGHSETFNLSTYVATSVGTLSCAWTLYSQPGTCFHGHSCSFAMLALCSFSSISTDALPSNSMLSSISSYPCHSAHSTYTTAQSFHTTPLTSNTSGRILYTCILSMPFTTRLKSTVSTSDSSFCLSYSSGSTRCDPLALPVAALLYQQADNFWLRKLAHGRELYLIPTGDIAAVVFGTELLSQLRTRGIDLDRVSHCRARQDGQTLAKINNTKYAAKVVAEYIQQWVPMKATDPSSQHTITQLQQQVAELKQRLGDTSDTAPPESSTPPPSTSSPSAPPPSTPIQRALQGNAATPPPEFEPASLLVTPLTANAWLKDNAPTSVAVRTYNQWLRDLNLTPAQRATVERNLAKVEERWNNPPE